MCGVLVGAWLVLGLAVGAIWPEPPITDISLLLGLRGVLAIWPTPGYELQAWGMGILVFAGWRLALPVSLSQFRQNSK